MHSTQRTLSSIAIALTTLLLLTPSSYAKVKQTETHNPEAVLCMPVYPGPTPPQDNSGYLAQGIVSPQCARLSIPVPLRISSNKVDVGSFKVERGQNLHHKKYKRWYLQKDKTGHSGGTSHGGSRWKIYGPSDRLCAALREDGTIIKYYPACK